MNNDQGWWRVTVRQEGIDAAKNGETRAECPYAKDTEHHALWCEGWRDEHYPGDANNAHLEPS